MSAGNSHEMTSLSSFDRDLARTKSSASRRSHSTSSLLDRSSFSNSTPKVTNDSSHWSQSRWQRFQSWRATITLGVMSAGFTLFLNLVLITWASKKGFEGGIATLQKGDCNMTKRLDLWLHLGINLLCTLLLGASNYTMQCLSAPTRDEIDKAHQQRISLDIGVPSVRNLRRISRRRIILWWLLALSSIPLHLMYNSAVFSTLSTHSYTAAVVSHGFLTGAPFGNLTALATIASDNLLTELRDKQSTLQNLSNDECLKAYRNELIPNRRHVLAISSATITNCSVLSYWPDNVRHLYLNDSLKRYYPYEWTCTASLESFLTRFGGSIGEDFYPCDLPTQDWTVFKDPIEYCLSERIEPSCKLQLSLVIMIIVLLCNFAKILCMSLTIWKPSSVPLLTLGDVIASFLDQPDPNTVDNCLASKHRFQGDKYTRLNTLLSRISPFSGYGLIDKNQHRSAGWDKAVGRSKLEFYRWYHAASLKRWLLCISLITLTLIIAGILLKIGLSNMYLSSTSMSYLWTLGYGGVSGETEIRFPSILSGKLIPLILIANLPQALLSFLYLTYNALFTSMLLAEEWSGFAHQRKTLRVTCPVGTQRSTYWLQLPYFYGIPLLVMSGILHWLVSQTIFLVRVVVEETSRAELDSTCGYSPIAIITVIPLGALLLLVVIANGFRKYKQGMPLAGSCSAAISAACHRPREDVDAAVLPVLWGSVGTEGPIGHCCFTSFEISAPVEGELYADRDAMPSMDSGTATGVGSDRAGSGLRSRT